MVDTHPCGISLFAESACGGDTSKHRDDDDINNNISTAVAVSTAENRAPRSNGTQYVIIIAFSRGARRGYGERGDRA